MFLDKRFILRRFICRGAGWFLLAFAMLVASAQERIELNPAEFKAAILSKVPPYVQWPDRMFADPTEPLVIGVIGKEPFQDLLEKLLKDKTVNGRAIVLKSFETIATFQKCHILFVPAAYAAEWQESRDQFDTFGVLTIGETPEFLKSGGVCIVSVPDRKLEIHLKNASQAGLKIDSKLLKIAKVVKG